MNESVGATIDAAVDAAVSNDGQPGQAAAEPTTPAKPATPSPDSASLPEPPAAGSGPEPAQPDSATNDGEPTTRAADDDAEIRDDASWLTLDKRRTILANAREKAAQGARAELLGTLGIPESVNLDHVAPHVRELVTDEVAYYNNLGKSLRARGLLSEPEPASATREPARAAGDHQPASGDFVLPEPRLFTEKGQGLYDTQDMEAIVRGVFSHVQGLLDQRLEPHEKLASEVAAEKRWLAASNDANHEFEEAKQWPQFRELGKRIGQIMRAAVERKDTSVTLRAAYNEAFVEKTIREAPQQEATIRKRLAAESHLQPDSTDIAAPSAPVVRQPAKRGRTLDDVFDRAVKDAFAKHGG